MTAICRFAPSPNGALHLGHAYSALRNEAVAAETGGRLLVRLEDIDAARCTPALAAAVLEELRWLGVTFEPAVRRQSDHLPDYAAALDTLARRGLLYPCFCSRVDVARAVAGHPGWPRDLDGAPLYPGTCRTLAPGERTRRLASGLPHALRLDMQAALAGLPGPLGWCEYGEGGRAVERPADPSAWGDAVLRRKDIPTSYHIAVVVDDAGQGVTDVVRGLDIEPATALHRLLQALLGHPAPRYHHHRLVLDPAGRKLSKSAGAPSLAALRRNGLSGDDVRRRLAALMGPP